MRKIGKNTWVNVDYDGTGISVIPDRLLSEAWLQWRKVLAGLINT